MTLSANVAGCATMPELLWHLGPVVEGERIAFWYDERGPHIELERCGR
jgi:hypothetical protein